VRAAEYQILVDNCLIAKITMHHGDTQEQQAIARRQAARDYKIPERFITLQRAHRARRAA
jgi:hypothetical protein